MLFWRDRSGNFSIMAALVMVPLLAVSAMAVDFGLALSRKAQVQAALDAGVLAAASMPKTTALVMQAEATKVFRANLPGELRTTAVVDSFDLSTANLITMTAHAAVPLTVGRIAFGKAVDVKVISQSIRGDTQKGEIALVLDNTYSMTGQKLIDLKAAATELIQVIEAAKSGTIRISVVPFARYVNVGLQNRSQPWLSVQPDSSTTSQACSTTTKVLSKSGCTISTVQTFKDGIPQISKKETCTNYVYGDPVTVCAPKTTTYTWSGCVGSRRSPLDVSDAAPEVRYTGLINVGCGRPIVFLTSDFDSLRKSIAAMSASDETYITAGILWGWNTLSSIGGAEPPSRSLSKYMVVMTDGANTLSPSASNYTYHNGSSTAQADLLMEKVCTNAKAAGITIFTVAVGVSGSTAGALERCASDSSKVYTVSESSRLVHIFRTIAGQIMTPRLTQ